MPMGAPMPRPHAAPAALLALAVLAPATLAEHGAWRAGPGPLEPSTTFDDASTLFAEGNARREERVYFDARLVTAPVPGGPTVSATLDGGRVRPPAAAYVIATLGFWRDCNRDGYVGLKVAPGPQGSLGQYPLEAAVAAGASVDASVCPPGSRYWPRLPDGSPGRLVDELRAIGPCPPTRDGDCATGRDGDPARRTNDVPDALARVWGDFGPPALPRALADPVPHAPSSAFADSDGTLAYTDALTSGALARFAPALWSAKPNVGSCDEPHPTPLGGSGGTCGAWPLYQVARLPSDASCDESGTCTAPDPLVRVFDVDPEDSHACNRFVGLPRLSPRASTDALADGSVAGTLAHAEACASVRTGLADECGVAPCAGSAQAPRERPDFVLTYAWARTTDALAPLGVRHFAPGAGMDNEGFGGSWFGELTWMPQPSSLHEGATATAYTTAYADVSPTALARANARPPTALPAGAQDRHAYGAHACATITTGPPNVDPASRWDCSVTTWRESRASPLDPVLGDRFDLRDVDCYDNAASEDVEPALKAGLADCAWDGTATHAR